MYPNDEQLLAVVLYGGKWTDLLVFVEPNLMNCDVFYHTFLNIYKS